MTTPRWSVVIPTFDRHDALDACLARLAPGRQRLAAAEYEVIVSDDTRSATTRTFLAQRHPWVRYHAGPARGPAANRNAGATQARGEWLVFTDDDTLPEPGWLEAFARAAVARPPDPRPTDAPPRASAGTQARVADPDALEGRTSCPGGFGTPMHYAPVNETGGRFWSCNIAVRAERFRALGGFDEGFTVAHMEDQDLRERLQGAGARIAWVPEAHVTHAARRQPPGRVLGMQRRAEVRYRYKHGAPRPVRWRLLRGVASLRLGIIRALPWSLDSLRAFGSLLAELATVARHAAAWEREAAAEFPEPDPARVACPPATLSVLVPAYRRPAEVARCLRALAAQTRAPDEVIVIVRTDDAATEAAARAQVMPAATRLVVEPVDAPGVVAAMRAGLARATGEVIALTDDDAEPRADWCARLLDALAADTGLAGVGGRDWQPHERGDAREVGVVRWSGRVVGRHHLGAGPPRDVDVLKGVNCAFRAAPLRGVGFDARLRGEGAQVHWELATCLPLRRAGWRLRYDPAIAVEHHVAPREGEDQVHRGRFAAAPFADAAHNEALALREHLRGVRGLVHALWRAAIGATANPGLLAALRLRLQGHRWAWAAWAAARDGRRLARETHRRDPRA